LSSSVNFFFIGNSFFFLRRVSAHTFRCIECDARVTPV
jgi:hypothetical protein